MSLEDSFRKYGAEIVHINMEVLTDLGIMVTRHLRERQQRPVVTLAVAAMLIQMHSDVAGVEVEETIELVRSFINALDMSQRPKDESRG